FEALHGPEGRGPAAPVGQAWLRVGAAWERAPAHRVDLRGPLRCVVVHEVEVQGDRRRLGPDPLDPDADPARARERVSRSSRPLGALLMDQKVLAGAGNVYRAEVLFRAGLDPFRSGTSRRGAQWRRAAARRAGAVGA